MKETKSKWTHAITVADKYREKLVKLPQIEQVQVMGMLVASKDLATSPQALGFFADMAKEVSAAMIEDGIPFNTQEVIDNASTQS